MFNIAKGRLTCFYYLYYIANTIFISSNYRYLTRSVNKIWSYMNVMDHLSLLGIITLGTILILIVVVIIAFYFLVFRQICCLPRRYKSKRFTCSRDSIPLTNVTHISSQQPTEIEKIY